MAENHETQKMAIVPAASPSTEPSPISKPTLKENNSRVALHLDALASGFKVDAILSIYAGQHAASPAVKKFVKALGKRSAEVNAQLKQLGAEHRFPLPVSIIPVHENELAALKGKRKAEFDVAYVGFIQHMLNERTVSAEFLAEYATIPELQKLSGDYIKDLNIYKNQLKKFPGAKK